MLKLKITRRMLRDLNACPEGFADFARVFPRGVTLYDDQEKNIPAVLRAFAGGCAGDLYWLLAKVTPRWYHAIMYVYHDDSAPRQFGGDTSQACAVLAEAVRRYHVMRRP